MRDTIDLPGPSAAGVAVSATRIIAGNEVVSPSRGALVQAFDFAEALHQTKPIARTGVTAIRAGAFVAETTARVRGVLPATAYRLATTGRELLSFIAGPHPIGKTAEIVVAGDVRDLPRVRGGAAHAGGRVVDVRLSPDTASRHDLVIHVRDRAGTRMVPGGQVKTGSGQYVSDSLVRMARTPGYGRVGYVDARFVDVEGSPRVAPDAFTQGQARKLRDAGVRLHGIPQLEERARALATNILEHSDDGLDPIAREELLSLRDEIAQAYGASGVLSRVAGSALSAAATSAVVNVLVQQVSGGTIEVGCVTAAAKDAAKWGAGGAAADALCYHAAIGAGFAPEAARALAERVVAAGLCFFAVAQDTLAEAKAVRAGTVTVEQALSCVAVKSALGILPLAAGPLGIASMPLLTAIQVGGRWAIAAFRRREAALADAITHDIETAAVLAERLGEMRQTIGHLAEECDETDRLFEQAMAPAASPLLRLVR
ncbi:MAG: hypothetical protein U0441_23105 [Polyangiaceae bacterium]